MNLRTLLFTSIIVGIWGCNKEPDESDYRNPYTGSFKFVTIRKGISMCYEPSPTCIDGWEIVSCDTSFISNKVEKVDMNRLRIPFGGSILELDFDDNTIEQITNPILSQEGELSLSEYSGEIGHFKGYFIGYDTIILNIRPAGGIGSYSKFEVTGMREN